MKKLLSMFLAIAIVMCMVPLGAFTLTVSAETDGYYTYTVLNDKAIINEVDTLISGDITIPSTLGGYPVTNIGWGAFANCSDLSSVIIPHNVIYISQYAFSNCNNLTSIEIPDSVTSIGNNAFNDCTSLVEIRVDENNRYYCDIDGVLFNKNITELIRYPEGKINSTYTILESVISIGVYAFYDCRNLINVTIPDSVTSIGGGAFAYCVSLESITIPDSVTSIGEFQFYCCSSLVEIRVDENNQYYCDIDGVLFDKNITELFWYPEGKINSTYTIPDGVTSIGDYAFDRCENLTNIIIPDSVISIGYMAFYDCSNLANVTVSNGLTNIGDHAFGHCNNLTSIEIPDSVTSIGMEAFRNCDGLTSIAIPDSVTSISEFTFEGCDGLTSVTIGNSVTSIGDYAFYSCDSLTSITIPDSVTSIGDHAFEICDSLTSITIPDSVTSIGDQAFEDCDELWHVLYTGTESEWDAINLDYSQNEYLLNATRHYNADGNEITHSKQEPTCTEDGYTVYQCTICNEEYKNDWIWLNGHTTGDIIEIVSPTCTEYGYTIYQCAVCNEEFEGGPWVWQGHTKGNVIETVSPTCTEYGYTVYQCAVCNEEFEGDRVWQGHTKGDIVETVPPTCMDEGYTVYQCTVCDEEVIADWTEPTGHNAQAVNTVDATCIENGYIEYYCNDCGESYNSDITAPIGHNFENDVCVKCSVAKEDCVESSHDYENNCDETWVINKPNADYITITFSSATQVENDWDFIYIYDKDDNLIGRYTGTELASQTVTVTGNIIKIRLTSDESNTYYGFAVSNIISYVSHTTNDIKVSMPENTIDPVAELKIDEVDSGNIAVTLPQGYSIENANVYDIYFEKDGNNIQPNGQVTVYIPVSDDVDKSKCKVFHIDEFGNATDMNAVFENGYMVFTTDHFSYYALVDFSPDDIIGDANNDGSVNTRDAAIVMQYANGWTVDINIENADVNGDGIVNTRDYALLIQYANGWGVELK